MRVKDGQVYVKISDGGPTLDSDRYFTEEYRTLIENVLKEPVLQSGRTPGVNVPLHSIRSDLPPAPRR